MKSLVKISLIVSLFAFSANTAAATITCTWGPHGIMAHTAIRTFNQTFYEQTVTQTLYVKAEAWVFEGAWVSLNPIIVWVTPSEAPLTGTIDITSNIEIQADANGFISLYDPDPYYLSQDNCDMNPDLLIPALM